MAWTYDPTIQKSLANGNKTPSVTVTFFDAANPARIFVEVYLDDSFSQARLEAWVVQRVASYQARFDAFDAFTGPLGVINPPTSDPKVVAKSARDLAYRQLQGAKLILANAVDADAIKAGQTLVDAAQATFDTAVKDAESAGVGPTDSTGVFTI